MPAPFDVVQIPGVGRVDRVAAAGAGDGAGGDVGLPACSFGLVFGAVPLVTAGGAEGSAGDGLAAAGAESTGGHQSVDTATALGLEDLVC